MQGAAEGVRSLFSSQLRNQIRHVIFLPFCPLLPVISQGDQVMLLRKMPKCSAVLLGIGRRRARTTRRRGSPKNSFSRVLRPITSQASRTVPCMHSNNRQTDLTDSSEQCQRQTPRLVAIYHGTGKSHRAIVASHLGKASSLA